MACLRKQISFFLPLPQWLLVRNEAIRLGIPITELCRRWMSEEMRRLESTTGERESGQVRNSVKNPSATDS
jgi:hypothetical protein